MEKQTIIVTGGAGFVGTHLVRRLLQEGKRVMSLDDYSTGSESNHLEGVEYIKGSTKDIEQLLGHENPATIYHLGEYSRVEQSFHDIPRVWDSNMDGSFAVFEYWRKRGCKLLYAGSSTKFADGGMGRDQSPYAFTKATNTELVKNYGEWFKLPYAITYFYNVYGPGERAGSYGTVIEIFRQQALAGGPITVVAPGTQRRNFTHVNDIVSGLFMVGEKGQGDEYGLGNPESFSVLEVAELFGTQIKMMRERPGNRMDSKVDTVRAECEFNWRAEHDLRDYIKSIRS